jgi:acetolactate synthase-1/2/3 large subunit
MKRSGAELVVQALEDEGIRFAFGIPGTHNIELYDALAESRRTRAVLVTDEQSAGFMADGVWRAARELACVNLVPGAGLTHALSGIAEAFLDGIPLLVLGCGIRRDLPLAYQLHDVDQLAIARPVTKTALRSERGADLYRAIRDAAALSRRGPPGPVMVEVPVDQYLTRHEPGPLEPSPEPPGPLPDPESLAETARLLSAPGCRPLLYLGWGAAGAGADLVRLAEALGAPVATTIQGKGVFPESHPLFLWNGFGRAAPPFAAAVAAERNVTLAIGCRFSEVGTASYSSAPRGPLIHADVDPTVFDRNFPAAVKLTGDAAEVVAELLRRIEPRPPAERARIEAAIAGGHRALRSARAASLSDAAVTPSRLFETLAARFGPETIFATDSGNGTFLAVEQLRLDRPGKLLAPVDYSCMGYAVPAAIGAKLARPDCPVVALPGDGAFLMTGLELLTAANQGAPIATFVLRDRELGQIAQFQDTVFRRKTASVLPDYDVAGIAEAVGVEWIRLERDQDVEEAAAYAATVTGAGRPIVVDTAIDYSEPTFFTRGVVRTNLGRLPLADRLRLIGRAVGRRIRPPESPA